MTDQTPITLLKAVSPSTNIDWRMEDISEPVIRQQVNPGLLSAILMPNMKFGQTDSFSFDDVEYGQQLPTGKAYTEVKNVETKLDRPRKLYYEVPSFGIGYTLTPSDIAKRRKMGTNELMDEEDLIVEMEMKIRMAWSLHKELALAQIVTTDTNIISGGPFTSYNFHTEIVGTARAAAIDMDLGSTTADQFIDHQEQRELLEDELARYGLSASRIVVLCGRTYFNSRWEIEKQEGTNRDLQNTVDLVSEMVPDISDGNFKYSMFESHDGLIYIKYSANIDGTKLIADADAYMMPLGLTENIITMAHAPAITRSYVNTTALPMYTWAKSDEREGITVQTESNYLMANKRPLAIRHLTTTTFQ